MWKIEKKLYNRIKYHYDNRGGMGKHSGHFEKLPISVQNEILLLTNIDCREEDVLIASYLKSEYLVVISNESLYWMTSENLINRLPLEEIKHIGVNLKESFKRIRGMDCLKLETTKKESFTIRMEEGKTFSSMHNVLLLIAGLSK